MTAWVPPPGAELATKRGLPYHQLLRGGFQPVWWRSMVGVLALAASMLLLLPLLVMVPFAVYYGATGQEIGSSVARLVDLTRPTPAGLAYLNLALAGLIPVTWVLIRFLHGLRPRWLSSPRHDRPTIRTTPFSSRPQQRCVARPIRPPDDPRVRRFFHQLAARIPRPSRRAAEPSRFASSLRESSSSAR